MSTMGSHSSEPNTKRRRLERDSSRSGLGSEDEGVGGDELAGTPHDSVHTFTTARLGSATGPVSPGPPLFPPLTAEPGGEGLVKRESGEGGRESESTALVEGGGEIKEGELIQTSGAYCAREARWNTEEMAGRLKFVCHYNDGIEQHMMWLVGLKNIFARQLPNMPKEYIVRLVLDRSHKSMMIIKHNVVVGGITYRPYLQQKFGEIAFCAITASEQVKGYGTRLMNQLKQYARDEDKLTHFLTYADNNAVGYFSKQGFTKHISLEEERWKGFIKDYDGGTLMECVLEPLLPYIDLPNVIRRQRQAIDAKIRELSNCHLVYPGLELHKNEYGVPRKPIKIEDIPGLKAAGWTPEESPSARLRLVSLPSDGPPSRSQLHTFLRSLHRVISEHPDAWPFKEPVNPKEVADYYDVIKDPIDLKTMSKRLDSEVYYLHLEMFVSDMRRMFSNAMKYNSPETIYYKAAKRLEVLFMNRLKAGVQLSRSAAQGS